MLELMKTNKMFTAVVTILAITVMVLCYGLAVRNVAACVIGFVMLVAATVYSFAAARKEARRNR